MTDQEFYDRADLLRLDLEQVMHRPAQHVGIQKIQNIFRENAGRLYHWAKDRAVAADNNLSERDLRSLVIARKISFGSQAQAGAKTREILMTTLVTFLPGRGEVRPPPVTEALPIFLGNGEFWVNITLFSTKQSLDNVKR